MPKKKSRSARAVPPSPRPRAGEATRAVRRPEPAKRGAHEAARRSQARPIDRRRAAGGRDARHHPAVQRPEGRRHQPGRRRHGGLRRPGRRPAAGPGARHRHRIPDRAPRRRARTARDRREQGATAGRPGERRDGPAAQPRPCHPARHADGGGGRQAARGAASPGGRGPCCRRTSSSARSPPRWRAGRWASCCAGPAPTARSASARSRRAGGIAIAQDPARPSRRHARAAIATGAVDLVLPPAEIARELVRIARHPSCSPAGADGDAARPARRGAGGRRRRARGRADARLFAVLRNASGVDFTHYKRPDDPPPAAAPDGAAQDRPARQYVQLPPAPPRRGQAAVPGPADPRHPVLPRPRVVRGPGRAASSPRSPPADSPTSRSASGCPAARPARRRTRSRSRCWSSWATARQRDAGPDLRHRRQRAGGRARAAPASTPRHRRATCRRSGCGGSSARPTGKYRINKMVRDLCVFARQDLTRDPPFSRWT